MTANIAFPRYSRIGPGAINELPAVIASLGLQRPLLVTDAYLSRTGATDRVLTLLRDAGLTASVFDRTVPDPTTESLDLGVESVRAHNADCVIGFPGEQSSPTQPRRHRADLRRRLRLSASQSASAKSG